MNFEYSSEQSILKDSVNRLVDGLSDISARSSGSAQSEGHKSAGWQAMAEMGLLGLPFSEEDGGFGGGPIEQMIVMEAIGRGLITEPYLGSVILGGGIVKCASDKDQRKALITPLASGESILSFAHEEDRGHYLLSHVATRATKSSDGWILSGHKTGVLAGGQADKLIVSARSSGKSADENGLSLFLVPVDLAGVRIESYLNYDGLHAAAVSLDDVKLEAFALIGTEDSAFSVIEQVTDEAIAAVASEAVGAMEAMLWTTVEYLKTREQFGAPIGRFQALQHRAAEMFVMLEQARSMAIYATMMASNSDRAERRRAISAAKVQICESARFVGQQAVQLHGGMGITEECLVSHHFRRTTMIERQFGDMDHHLNALDHLGGLNGNL